MKSFRVMALLSTLATYFLIFVGGLVRVSGAGLGCPDWPKCFGSWLPPMSAAEIPAHIDPSQFNLTLAWIEWGNRLAGVTLGFMIVAVALLAIRHFRPVKTILYPSIASAFLVAFQGWQGSMVVASELKPILISTHLIISLVIVSLLIWVTIQAYAREHSQVVKPVSFGKGAFSWVQVLWLALIGQIVLGTMVRSSVEHLLKEAPDIAPNLILGESGLIVDFHMIAGNLVTILIVIAAIFILKGVKRPPVLVSRSAKLMIGLVIIQLFVGLILLGLGLNALVQLFHLWLSALLIGLVLVLYAGLKLSDSLPDKSQHSLTSAISVFLIVSVLMGIGGHFVIKQAHASIAEASIVEPLVQNSID